MISNSLKRNLSFALAMVMVLSFSPLHAFAAEVMSSSPEIESVTETTTEETSETDPTIATEPINETEPVTETLETIDFDVSSEAELANNSLLQHYQSNIDDLLIRYLGITFMSSEEVYIAVAEMGQEYQDALLDCYTLEQEITVSANNGQLTDEELYSLSISNDTFCDFYEALVKRQEREYGLSLLATTQATLADGAITVEYDDSYSSITNGNVSVSITGGLLSRKETSITISNSTATTATLAFDYSASNYNSFTIGGSSPSSASGSYSVDLESGASIQIKIKSNRKSDGAAILTVSNIKLVSEGTLTLDYNTLGSVTVAGTAVADGGTAIIPKDGATLVATPINGATFLGWVNHADRSIISQNATHLLTLDKDTTIEAVFVNNTSVPYFRVGKAYLFDNLTDAIECTATSGIKTIISVNDGTLAAGNYTIPSDVTFLIPFDSADTICMDNPSDSAMSSTATPSAYRTLKVPAGSTITCNGILNVNGQRRTSGQPNSGTAAGKHGNLVLDGSGTQLTITSGGKLYCYGYITGTGGVELASNSEMHELLQMCDWPGGTNASNWNSNSDENTLFLSSRYYLQNVEAPLRVYNGASVYCEAILYVSKQTLRSSTLFVAPSDNSQGLFLMGDGTYLDRTYNATNDRITYSLGGNGTVTFGSIEVELDDTIKALLAIMGINLDLNSSSYVLPINNAMTIAIESGVTVNMGNRVAVLPGAEVIIKGGGRVNLTNRVYILDLNDWTSSMAFGSQKAVPYTVGRGSTAKLSIENSGQIEVNGTLNITGNGGIYTTTGVETDGTTSNNEDKIIIGTGTIIHDGTTTDATLKAGYNATLYELSLNNGLANLAGLGTMKSIANGTYYGLGPDHNNYWYQTKETKDPTCGAPGYILYNCTGGSGYQVPYGIATGNHSYNTSVVTTAPTCTEAGVKTFTCGICGHSYTEDLYVAKVGETSYKILSDALAAADRKNNVTLLTDISGDVTLSKAVTIDKAGFTANVVAGTGYTLSENGDIVTALVKICATNIAAGDGLDLYFYVMKSAIGSETDYYAVITRNYADEEPQTITLAYNDREEITSGGIQYVRFCYADIAAKEMTDKVTATIYYSDNTQASNAATETVKTYAVRALGSSTTQLNAALMDMLNYGAGAQTYFGYNTENLANTDDTNTDGKISQYQSSATQNDVSVTNNLKKGENLAAVSVSAKNRLMMTFYFQNITPEMTAKVRYTNHYNNPVEKTISGSEFYKYGSWYGVDVIGLPVADGRTLVTCEVYNGDTLCASATDSVEGYAQRAIEQGSNVSDLMKLLMKFVDSADAYFDSLNN